MGRPWCFGDGEAMLNNSTPRALKTGLMACLAAAVLPLTMSATASANPGAESASAAEVCGSYSHDGSRFFANCEDHGVVVRYHKMLPPGFLEYKCVPAKSTEWIAPSYQVWGAFDTGSRC